MMRRCSPLLAHFIELHEWHLREPLLQNYEGWRILDNPKFENKGDAYTYDLAGSVRFIDPIIDDPRLTHKQRVCRLYRWSLKELQMYLVRLNAFKFNMAYKVVRNRFERYRYVTDPAMCDLMVRETQKYLREYANYHYMKRNPGSPYMNLTLANPMFHPDHAQNYDHWTQPEVFWYDDAKLQRWNYQHPMYSATYAQERFGRYNFSPVYNTWLGFASFFIVVMNMLQVIGLYHLDDEAFYAFQEKYSDPDLKQAVYEEERLQRGFGYTSLIDFDWNNVVGPAKRFYNYGSDTVMPPSTH